MPTPDVVVIVPMLGRGEHVRPLLDSLADEPRARALFVVTEGDDSALTATVDCDRIVVAPRRRGDYAAKINAGYRASTEPLLFLAASDVRFRPGWLDACLSELSDGIGVVGTNDLCNPRTADGRTSTHSLVTRAYVDRFGTVDEPGVVLHEGYWHEFVDDEFVGTAKSRNTYAHATDAHVEHLHWSNGRRARDRVDAEYDRRMAYGRRLYTKRRRLWRR